MVDIDNESVYLLDMASCEPASAISSKFERSKWTAVDYEIEAGTGRMLFCGRDIKAPPVRLKLGATGRHRIFVGTYAQLGYDQFCLLLKLSNDPGYTRATPETFRADKDLVEPEMLFTLTDLSEAYWKTADLTGQDIFFHRPAEGEMSETVANIAYIRIVPVSGSELAWETNRATRPLIANYDSGQHTMWSYTTHQDVVDEFQSLADSDFKIALWGCAGSFATFYPSNVGSELEWSYGLSRRMGSRLKSVDLYRRYRLDPLRSAVQCAHDIGIEIYPQVRMMGERLPPHHLGYSGPGDFQTQHPEWRCRTVEGYKARHLSQAFPQVRAKYVELFREWVEDYEGDGVCIIFCRSFPYVLYEEPVANSFMEKYGLAMKDQDPFDERVLNHRAGFLTQLLRETREMLDQVGSDRGLRLGTCYVIAADAYTAPGCPDLGPFTTPKSRGIDVETWLKEGLVDHLIVHIEGVGAPDASDRTPLIKAYVDLARGTDTKVYADLYPRRQSAESFRVRSMACYETGVDGLCFWDCQGRALRLSSWALHRVMGHKEELPEMKSFAENLFRVVPIISLDEFMVQAEGGLPTDG